MYNSDMEIANQPLVHPLVREARPADARVIRRLLTHEFYTHRHVDWYNSLDWLGSPGFVVYEEADTAVSACLAITADPAPAAWVRLLALTYNAQPLPRIKAMLNQIIPALQAEGVTQIFWMSTKRWADRWLPQLGFEQTNWLEAYIKEGLALPPQPNGRGSEVQIRPVLPEDFGLLAALEERVYAPEWRHSARGLHRAWHKGFSFDVARLHGRVVGFQHSMLGPDNGAHLARITIDTAVQGHGVGTALLTHAIRGYERAQLERITLNTQQDNTASHHLYRKFGFTYANYRLPIWQLSVCEMSP